jgi:hypothetical protein
VIASIIPGNTYLETLSSGESKAIGWHGPANLKIPDGIRLIYLPPYSPELQPAETLWALVDEPMIFMTRVRF